MTTRPLATKPEEFAATFAATFNRGSLDEVVAGYTEDAVLNLGGGNVQRGHSEIRAALANFLAPRLPMQVTPRTHSVSGDTALVMFDWVIDGFAPDGQKVLMQGSAVDVLRRGQDGYWRQFLDCPFGSATEPS
jgi:uncharacterized protein (TIGR02246 family)